MVERGTLAAMVEERYAGWNGGLGASILSGGVSLEGLAAMVEAGEIDPLPVSGHQELYENVVNRHIWSVSDSTGTGAGAGNAAD
jgi:xylose isomerase